MKRCVFVLLIISWLTVMVCLAMLGPPGKHAGLFGGLYAFAFVLLILLIKSFPDELTAHKVWAFVFLLSISVRLVFLFFPVGNDIFRYVWEGYIQTLGHNPYTYSPDSPTLAKIAQGELSAVWQKINHKDLSAGYPPASLLLFKLLAAFSPNPLFFKAVLIGFDLGVLILLAKITKFQGFHPVRLLLYAANPLVLVFFAGEGHLDIIQVFFLWLGFYLILTKKDFWGFFSLGLAAMSKYFAVMAIPFMIHANNYKKSWAALLPLCLFLPYLDAGVAIFQSLGVLGVSMHYNDSFTVALRWLFGELSVPVAMLSLSLCLGWIYLIEHNHLRSLYLVFGCLLLFLPTLHPWYLVLMTPFLIFFPSKAWLYLHAAVAFTFPVMGFELESGIFQEIQWLKLFEYLPFYVLLIYGFLRDGFLLRDKTFPKPLTVSVIVPTLNEAENMARCLASVENQSGLKEVIIADGGSTDSTLNIAEKFSAKVVNSPKGRGIQIHQGIVRAAGDVMMILHADCVLQRGALLKVLYALGNEPHAVGGAFHMKFEAPGAKALIISFLNNLRSRITGISFGDQAQFFRIQMLDLIGGFPKMMLMEDVELSYRLKESGRLLFVKDGVTVSSRHWEGKAFAKKIGLVLRLFTRFLIERRLKRGDPIKQDYYTVYYVGRK